jgi:nicotinamidase-related amidase
MRKIFILFSLLLIFISEKSFSQDVKGEAIEPVVTSIKPALLVVDIQNLFLGIVPEREKNGAMSNIIMCINLFRKNGWPVIAIYHENLQYGPKQGSEQFEFPAIVPLKPEDARVIKHYPDGFNKTDLDKILKEKGCNTVFICGLSATGCVLATWYGAQNHDYKAFLLKYALMSPDSENTKKIEDIFDAISYQVFDLMVR